MPLHTKKTAAERQHLLGLLLTAWEAEGYVLGTDKYLAIQEVMDMLPDEMELEEMKTYLSPLLVNDPQKQKDFYQIFDQVLVLCPEQLSAHAALVIKEKNDAYWNGLKKDFTSWLDKIKDFWLGINRLTRYVLLSLAFLLLVGIPVFNYVVAKKYATKATFKDQQVFLLYSDVRIKKPQLYCFQSGVPELRNIVAVELVSPKPTHINLLMSFDSSEVCFDFVGLVPGRDDLQYNICFSSGACLTINVVFRVDGYAVVPPPYVGAGSIRLSPSKVPEKSVQKESKILIQKLDKANTLLDTSQFTNQPGQYVSEVSAAWSVGTGHAYITLPKGIIIALAAGLLYLIGLYLHRKRQKFAIQQQLDDDKPYAWTIRIPFLDKVKMGDSFYLALAEMRRRIFGAAQQLDMPNTIKSTIKRGGMIDFRYKFHLNHKYYLFLVDIHTPQDQRTKVFDLILDELKAQEAPIEVFYYAGDISRCWNEKYKQGLSLQHIQHKYRDYYLIVWGKADAFVDNDTQEWADWTNLFDAWHSRVLLYPVPPSDWGELEAIVAQKFRIIPGTPKGLASLVETLEAVDPKPYLLWQNEPDIDISLIVIPAVKVGRQWLQQLEAHLVVHKNGERDDRLLRWVAACAIPPVLIWDWMLYAGDLLAHPGEPFLNLDHLYKITRISWFSEGQIPEPYREALLEWLEETHPNWEIKWRHEWGKVMNLESNLPPIGTMAWKGHRIQVILNELLQNTDWVTRRKLEEELDRLLLNKPLEDAILIKYIETRTSKLDKLLSERFRKFVQEKRGFNWYWRDWTWQVSGTLLVLLATLFIHYTEPVRVFNFENTISKVAFSSDNTTFVATGSDGSVALCKTDGSWLSGKKDHRERIVESSFSENGNTLFTGGADGILKFWDISGAPLYAYKTDQNLITAMKFTADHSQIFIGYYNGEAKLWDVAAKRILATFIGHKDAILDVDIAPSGKEFLTCCRDGSVNLWTQEGVLLRTLVGHKDQVITGCFSPNGQNIATGSRDETAILWTVEGNMLNVLNGHQDNITDIHFTNDSERIITASEDKTVKIWDLNGRLLRTLEGHTDKVNTMDISPYGTMLLTGSSDYSVRLWKLK
jgi:hypothetical protein